MPQTEAAPSVRQAAEPGPFTWAIVTGEYPPQRGGVSDYTRLLAHALAAAGDQVHVWAPEVAGAHSGPQSSESPVHLHRLPGHFGFSGLRVLDRQLRTLPPSRRLLVQYVPHAYGWKAMNVAFCAWLRWRARRPVWVMYHEVAFPMSRAQPLKHNFLGLVNRLMAWLTARAAGRVYAAIPAWAELLPKGSRMELAPVPSNIPTAADPARIEEFRELAAPGPGHPLIGHFGTFGPQVEPRMEEILPRLLAADVHRRALLVGAGGDRLLATLLEADPGLHGRVTATGALPGAEVAAALSACDVLLQPYTDGASGRRGSLMAGLALGLPIVTTAGPRTEPMWKEFGAVAFAEGTSVDAFVAQAEAVLGDPDRRRELRVQSVRLYRERCALSNTVRQLRS